MGCGSCGGITLFGGKDGKTIHNGVGSPTLGNPNVGDFYIDTDNWQIYGPYSNSGWGNGVDILGTDGIDGADGLSLFVTYHDATGIPGSPTGDGTTDGWSHTYSSNSYWISIKNSLDINSGTWGAPLKIKGVDGVDGVDGGGSTYVDLTKYESGDTVPDINILTSQLANDKDTVRLTFDVKGASTNFGLVVKSKNLISFGTSTTIMNETMINQSQGNHVYKVEINYVADGVIGIKGYYRIIPITGSKGSTGTFNTDYPNSSSFDIGLEVNEIVGDGYITNLLVESIKKY